MNKAERERIRRAVRRCYDSANNRWSFNGRTFEMQMGLYRSHICIDANFESKMNEVTVWLRIRRVFKSIMDIESPRKKFVGDDCMIDALNWLADCIEETISDIQQKEWEMLNNQLLTPEVARRQLEGIFERIGTFAQSA